MTRNARHPVRARRRARDLAVRGGAAVVAVGATVVLAGALPAGAHASIDAPSAAPVNTDQTLNMYVPHEREDTIYNTDIRIKIATGWSAPACLAKASWSCSLEEGNTVVHFVKTDASLLVDNENFPFRVRSATEVGLTSAFPTIQTYNDGETADWIGAPGTPNPAPTIKTIPAGTTPPPTAAPTTTPHNPIPTTSPAVPAPSPTNPPSGGVDPSGGPSTIPTPGGAPTTTAPGAATSTSVAGDPAAEATDATSPSTPGAGTVSGTAPSGRNPLLSEGSEESASGVTASEDAGSAVPAIAGGAVVLALLVVGGGLAIRHRAPATLAGDESPEVGVTATEPPTEP